MTNPNIIIKPSLREIILRGAKDTSYFAHEILEEETHSGQDKALTLLANKQFLGIHTGNRFGKGNTVMIHGAHIGAYRPISPRFKDRIIPILNTSISQDQANIVFDKFCERLLNRPKFSWAIKDIKRSPFPHITFRTGIVWWFRNASQNGKYLEGRSYYYVNFDEADLQPEFTSFVDDIILPRTWDFNGSFSFTTTPRKARRNAYKTIKAYQAKENAGDTKYGTFQGDSRLNTFLDPSAIDRMNALKASAPRLFRKNVLGLFEDEVGCIEQSALDYCKLIAEGLSEPAKGSKYVNAHDFARSSTFNASVTIELGNPMQLRSWSRYQDPGRRNPEYWMKVEDNVRARNKKYVGRTVYDATGLGDVLDSHLQDLRPKPIGVKLTKPLEEDIIDVGVSVIQNGSIGLPLDQITQTLNGEYWSAEDELLDFEPSAKNEIIWDFVCALFLGIYFAVGKLKPSSKKPKAPPRVAPRAKGVSRYASTH